VFKASTTNTHISLMAMLLVFRSVDDDVLVQVKPSLHQAFSHVFNAMNLYFIHALLYEGTLVQFDEAMIIGCNVPAVILHFRCFEFHEVVYQH